VTTPALEVSGVSKRYGAVEANREVDLRVEPGSVHALVGENGAGKSTLMQIVYGQTPPDSGSLRVKGERVDWARHGPAGSIGRGVGMVHQHFMLVGPLTVTENLVLGREPRRGPFVDLERAAAEVVELAGRFGFEVDPGARVEELSVGEQQRVEILKVLWQGCDVLILDEPTAVLTPSEVRELFGVLRALVAEGRTVVLITHKLDEVVAIADRVTVMRRGAVVGDLERGEEGLSAEAIARAMVGRPVLMEVDKGPASPGAPVLRVEALSVAGRGGRPALDGVSFELRAGEILGVAGVEGNGQSELVEALTGLRAVTSGRVWLGDRDVTLAPVADRQAAGLAHVPEDRHARGLVLDFSTSDNLLLGRQRELTRGPMLDPAAVRAHAEGLIRAFDVRPVDPEAAARGLSGGNQQKVVIARELSRPGLRLLVCAQPTRGVDIGAIELIHRRIVAARDEGSAVLLVSAELSEIRALADRVAVLYRGRIVDVLEGSALADQAQVERLGELMLGARPGGEP